MLWFDSDRRRPADHDGGNRDRRAFFGCATSQNAKLSLMKTDKGQFDQVLRRMLAKPPEATPGLKLRDGF
jgi:hypothetical protein